MSELESVIERKLIDQLVYGDSQWVYREDLKTEDDYGRISGTYLSRITKTGLMGNRFLMRSLNR